MRESIYTIADRIGGYPPMCYRCILRLMDTPSEVGCPQPSRQCSFVVGLHHAALPTRETRKVMGLQTTCERARRGFDLRFAAEIPLPPACLPLHENQQWRVRALKSESLKTITEVLGGYPPMLTTARSTKQKAGAE